VSILIGNPDHDAAHARMRAQAFKRVQDDGTTEKWEILLGQRRLHAQTLATRRYESPDAVSAGQKCRPTAFVWTK